MGTGQLYQTFDMVPYAGQGLKTLCGMALEAAALIHYHHVKRPCVTVIIHQPHHVLSVGDVDVCRRVQCFDPLCLASQYRGYPQHFCVIPLGGLPCPGSFCHLLGGYHQHPAYLETVILKLLNGRQCGDRLAKALNPYLRTGLAF